ncbi:hypothetical protein TUA1478L_20210 [Lactiplantibacillus plantarum]
MGEYPTATNATAGSNESPQQLLQQIGIPASVTHATYSYSGHDLPGVSYVMHFGFSTTFAVAYSLWARKHPGQKVAAARCMG